MAYLGAQSHICAVRDDSVPGKRLMPERMHVSCPKPLFYSILHDDDGAFSTSARTQCCGSHLLATQLEKLFHSW